MLWPISNEWFFFFKKKIVEQKLKGVIREIPHSQLGQMYISVGPNIAIVVCHRIIIKSSPFTFKIVTIWIIYCKFGRWGVFFTLLEIHQSIELLKNPACGLSISFSVGKDMGAEEVLDIIVPYRTRNFVLKIKSGLKSWSSSWTKWFWPQNSHVEAQPLMCLCLKTGTSQID